MSDTPMTDAKERETYCYGADVNAHMKHAHYGWKFARTLERENADLRAQIAAKDAEIERLRKILRRDNPDWLYIRMSLGELHIEKVLTRTELDTDFPFSMSIPYMYAALKDYESKVKK